MEQQSIADALGIQSSGGAPWYRRAACAGHPLSLFFPDRGSNHSAEPTLQEDRAKRVCVRCPVRRECLEDAYHAEGEQVNVIARNAKAPQIRDVHTREKALPVGVYGGTTPAERWAKDVVHTDDCKRRTDCKGCQPVQKRIALLEERLSRQVPRFLR